MLYIYIITQDAKTEFFLQIACLTLRPSTTSASVRYTVITHIRTRIFGLYIDNNSNYLSIYFTGKLK